jgi:hypothetical protein
MSACCEGVVGFWVGATVVVVDDDGDGVTVVVVGLAVVVVTDVLGLVKVCVVVGEGVVVLLMIEEDGEDGEEVLLEGGAIDDEATLVDVSKARASVDEVTKLDVTCEDTVDVSAAWVFTFVVMSVVALLTLAIKANVRRNMVAFRSATITT